MTWPAGRQPAIAAGHDVVSTALQQLNRPTSRTEQPDACRLNDCDSMCRSLTRHPRPRLSQKFRLNSEDGHVELAGAQMAVAGGSAVRSGGALGLASHFHCYCGLAAGAGLRAIADLYGPSVGRTSG